ncbi:cytochrome c oxidase subunit II [Pacificibacter marinus]|uniref:Cytochrome c oxidase subunit 2 n=1 Tax=Pacificibacter marinus TaxID=658057 RepID=A0A1Y5RH41_9RHOB|nr:cytochrome c oxidase subunit II [Pacificibacter marinus]SEK19205.1 cytochrome c oxidase subunit 2 [Pacificibacter marinus]SLN17251.1 Cytochrome c oxidase subunit 2 precursor [Pacificibacter marinus]
MRTERFLSGLAATVLATTVSGAAMAQQAGELLGAPVDGKMGFQPAATELARDLQGLDHLLLWITGLIVLFVCALMAWVMIRYNRKTNAEPQTFTHNTPIEIAWTIVPILVLAVIGAFSLPVLFKQQEIPEGDMYIKVTGYQWYWGYEYVDEGFGFDSYKLERDELAEYGYDQSFYLLATDTAVVVPVGKTVVMGVTGADVIHSWTIPAFGVKQDAVPGRVAELWFKAEKTGTFFGQCSELCGKDHAFMPITVKVVSQEDYDAWLAGAKEEFASLEGTTPELIQLASVQ